MNHMDAIPTYLMQTNMPMHVCLHEGNNGEKSTEQALN